MSRLEKLAAEAERARKAATWAGRITKLENRKTDPLDEAKFCRRADVNIPVFNRNKNGKTIPTDQQVKKVEAAFAAEGV